ncbi:hypothetical protein ACFQZC_16220 [Streptacidiphilus monticola]
MFVAVPPQRWRGEFGEPVVLLADGAAAGLDDEGSGSCWTSAPRCSTPRSCASSATAWPRSAGAARRPPGRC